MSTVKDLLNKAYAKAGAVPWDNSEPPQELIELIEQARIKPGKALDVGCGTGYYSIFLSQNGFDVTGIDISENAILEATKKAVESKSNIKFVTLDALEISSLNETYDFVLEWGLLHFIMPEFREKYVKDIAEKINKGGKYIVLTFNEESPEWGGGKYRTGLTGTPLYYSSIGELENLYKPYFKIIESKIRPIFFKNSGNKHLENYLLLEKI
jgi:2-polyprenyl-3-methyl-5-hydroxy-6-metoxy-1,4-benzoquinol methylase